MDSMQITLLGNVSTEIDGVAHLIYKRLAAREYLGEAFGFDEAWDINARTGWEFDEAIGGRGYSGQSLRYQIRLDDAELAQAYERGTQMLAAMVA